MSKTQDKRLLRKQEAADFVATRRDIQVALFENNLKAGIEVFQANKDKLTPEQIVEIEAQLVENQALLEKARSEAHPTT